MPDSPEIPQLLSVLIFLYYQTQIFQLLQLNTYENSMQAEIWKTDKIRLLQKG